MTHGDGEEFNGLGPTGDGVTDSGDDVEDAPLDESEAQEGALRAAEPVSEALPEVVGRTVSELEGVERTPGELGGEELVAGGVTFAVVLADGLEVHLEGAVARAALATPDTAPSGRGSGWVRFTPHAMDRFAVDRAESWLRFAYRRAGEGRG